VSSVFPVRLADVREQIALQEGNLTDRSALDVIARRVRPTHVFHLGAFTHVGKSWERVDECIQVNVQGTVNLLQALADVGYERFVNTGTSEIYGNIDVPFREDARVRPASPYALSKHAAEEFCRLFHGAYGWPIVMVRPFNAYGPGQTADRIIPEIVVRALQKQELKMTQGRQTREFNYVQDIADGFVKAATVEGVEGEIFNIGCGEEVAIRDLATTILDLMGNPIEAQIGALPDRPIEIWRMYCDSSKARERLGWAPRHTLAEGLEKTVDWYRTELERPDSAFWISELGRRG
jgi:nucleoside-diphosphate-sugar epimerase